ncbi:MAG: class I SAM-dependent methyltransferase [Microthrixaceae bacterium]|jgi:SAM-dependent methyltransferase|nr:class I SAM-dependent methyltransferase [Actinomycetota bacterium]HMS12384.1 class I SAM-dependent methyltransferase [Microthrixaceae bacterium]HMT25633.1 class I SAM-dependent methyltransferase [Microthrixaceae bacterium]HMT60662.1 class I SAM-dependent methyltransferase [Microthrixaceae bacterium]
MTDPWEAHAAWWQAEFTDGADPEYVEQILPLIAANLPSAGRLLDIGAGEGQVARVAAASGLDVVALDPAWRQVSVGQERGSAAWVQGSATSLPIADASVDAAVVCLVFEHVAALDDALAEVARVVRPGGTFLFLLNHPLLQTPGSGWIDDQMLEPPEQYWRIGEYLTEAMTDEEVEKEVFITFFHRPLHRYLNGAFAHGLRLVRMEEPAPPPGFLARAPEYFAAATVPRLLFLRFERV